MSEQHPHNDPLEQQFQNLPLPDENQAWDRMKSRLDEDDDDRFVLPLYFRSCAGWIVFVGLLVALWFVARPDRWSDTRNEVAEKQTSNTATSPDITLHPPDNNSDNNKESGEETRKDVPLKRNGLNRNTADTLNQVLIEESDPDPFKTPARDAVNGKSRPLSENGDPSRTEKPRSTGEQKRQVKREEKANLVPSGRPKAAKPQDKKQKILQPGKPQLRKSDFTPSMPAKEKEQPGVLQPEEEKDKDSSERTIYNNIDTTSGNRIDSTGSSVPSPDTLSKNITDSTLDRKPEDKPAKPGKKPVYYLAAGVSVQQQIPFAGQKAVPYNYYGRKGSLADYLPSVYARLYRDDEWFVQTEFRYGAPQSVREFAYSSAIVSDSGNFIRTTRTERLKKTFYHQVPVSFNYYVLPKLSVGGGFMFSKFYGAVTEQEIKRVNLQSGVVQEVSKNIVHISSASDSFFTKSQLHLLIESQYSWKRLSFGLRYSFGLQPYIRYKDQAGIFRQEKNRSLQAFLRFQVWNSIKKQGRVLN